MFDKKETIAIIGVIISVIILFWGNGLLKDSNISPSPTNIDTVFIINESSSSSESISIAPIEPTTKKTPITSSIKNNEKNLILDKSYKGDYAVVIFKNGDSINHEFGNKISRLINRKNLISTSSLFHSEFVSNEYFDKIFQGSYRRINDLGISKFASHLFLAEEKTSIKEDNEFGQITKIATISLSFKIVNTVTGKIVISDHLKSTSNDTDENVAYNIAVESLIKKVNKVHFP